jgi:AcrR family transcriptional regulator
LAGVSSRAFYENFDGKEECFLRTYDLIVQRAATRIAASLSSETAPRDRFYSAISAFVQAVVRKPTPARLALIEVSAAGPVAMERARAAEALFEAMLTESVREAPGEFRPRPLLVKGIVSGVCGVVRARFITGREHELSGIVEELVDWVTSFQIGAAVGIEKLALRKPASTPLQARRPIARPPNSNAILDDRPIILAAVAKLAASRSYSQLTVSRIRDAAGVSLRSFETHFENAEECFLEALELRVTTALEHATGHASGDNWSRDVYLTVEALCGELAIDPVFYAIALSEAFMTGPSGVRRRAEITATIAERLGASAPQGQGPSQVAAEASVEAVWAVLHHCVMTGQAELRLPRLVATLTHLILAPATATRAPRAVDEIPARSRVAS